MDDCIFCKIIKGEIPCIKVYEDDKVLAFADINPISKGHTLIIPKRHVGSMWEASEDELTKIMKTAKKLIHAIKDALNPQGVAVLQLNGRAVNQIVMHYHLHLIPRSEGEPELTMTAWKLIPGDTDKIKETAEKIASAIQ